MAGSLGKRTAIVGFDIDCVLFINDQQPPFNNVLDDYENVLNQSDLCELKHVRKTKYSIQFNLKDFKFDFLPATNFAVHNNSDYTDLEMQQWNVLRRIKKNPQKNGDLYSSSLARNTIAFFKRQSGFAHAMVRLAKFWYKSLCLGTYVSGAKYLIELVAIAAAQEEENDIEKSHNSNVNCFAMFIENMCKFDTLNIVFEEEYTDIFPEHAVTDNSRPRVMDPVNPYNNLARQWNEKAIEKIKIAATETRQRLFAGVVGLEKLFKPKWISEMICDIKDNPHRKQWLIEVRHQYAPLKLLIRNDSINKNVQIRQRLEFLQVYSMLLADSVMALPNTNAEDVRKKFKEMIKLHFLSKSGRQWSTIFDGGHDDFDVTLTIPVSPNTSIHISYRFPQGSLSSTGPPAKKPRYY